MSIGDKIKELRILSNLTQGQVAYHLGITTGQLSHWEKGRRKPSYDDVAKLAELFEVSTDFLIGLTTVPDGEVVSQVKIMNLKVPVYGIIPAGTPFEAIEEVLEEVSVPDYLKRKKDLFGLKVVGDSMNQILPDGFIAVFEKVDYLESGDVGAVYVDGFDATIKKYHRLNNSIILEPLSYNTEHEPIVIKDGEEPVVPIGKLVWSCAPKDYAKKW